MRFILLTILGLAVSGIGYSAEVVLTEKETQELLNKRKDYIEYLKFDAISKIVDKEKANQSPLEQKIVNVISYTKLESTELKSLQTTRENYLKNLTFEQIRKIVDKEKAHQSPLERKIVDEVQYTPLEQSEKKLLQKTREKHITNLTFEKISEIVDKEKANQSPLERKIVDEVQYTPLESGEKNALGNKCKG